jgi:hypothetical protein
MTHVFLQSELTSLVSDSKRRYNDVRTAAEQSLNEIKSISVTSETQLAGDLSRKPHFIEPFILACKTKNTKLATNGTACLQRLTASKAVPRARLPDVLIAFQDAVGAGYEPQLKILQTLPSLLQLYADDIHGDILAKVLEICAVLQSSKTGVVSNTAAATFQQLVSTVFENSELRRATKPSGENGARKSGDHGPSGTADEDAVRLFEDFCLLLDQQPPRFLNLDSLPLPFLLETLHTILASHDELLAGEAHDGSEWAMHLMQGISRSLLRRDNFGVVCRGLLILLLVLQNHAADLHEQVETMLPSLTASLERDGNPPWRRALFLEFFQRMCSDFNVLRSLFVLFDGGKDSAGLIEPLMSALVRITAEDPTLIGLGRQSTVPIQRAADAKSEEAVSIEAQGLSGAITSVASSDANATGISSDWSLMAVSLLDQPDKSASPALPSTYIYTLVLGCVAHLCDGLSKFIMPLSVPTRASQRELSELNRRDSSATDRSDEGGTRKSMTPNATSKYQRLINPLSLTKHRFITEIQTSASIIEACWPAALAASSTFLNAALDSEFYHTLIRSVQKLTQVSGVLELSTPRDALLTTLAKASLPANAGALIAAFQNGKLSRSGGTEEGEPSSGLKSPTEPPPTPTLQASPPLNTRHLLCLRALLNLGIALGPTLGRDAWFILIETLQTVECLIAMPTTTVFFTQSGSPRIGTSNGDVQTTLTTEIAAVQAATKRMLESTRGFSESSFADVVNALMRLLGQTGLQNRIGGNSLAPNTPGTPGALETARPAHHASRSISGLWTKSKSLDFEISFVLGKLNDLSRINIHRFTSTSETSCSWEMIGGRLLHLSQDADISSQHRIQAASILDLIAIETVKLLDDTRLDDEDVDAIRSRSLEVLLQQLEPLGETRGGKHNTVEMEIHKRLLDALESMLSHSGESLNNCWPIALQIISVSFSKRGHGNPGVGEISNDEAENNAQNAHILRVAFRSIQLITSDFLGVLDAASFSKLAHLLRQFGTQHYDLNVALTSTTVLWSLASHVLSKIGQIDIEDMPDLSPSDQELRIPKDITPGMIWSIVLLELVALCRDERADVRNAAIRVLLKMLDASSDNISAATWAVTLAKGPLNTILHCILESCADADAETSWMASVAQLTEGAIQLMCQNMAVIAESPRFNDTWAHTINVFQALLKTDSPSASSLAFSSLSKVLAVLPTLKEFDETLLQAAVQLWAEYHPANIEQTSSKDDRAIEDVSNQQAFTAHAHTLVEAYKTSPSAVSQYLSSRTSILIDAIEREIMLCMHPPYTNDVKSLAPEQKEVCDCLEILKTLLRTDVSQYTKFLLRLLSLTLGIQDGKVIHQQKRSAMSKSVQKPLFIAFAAACVDMYRNLILEYSGDENFIEIVAVEDACPVLSSIVPTKYTKIPTNSQAPLWRNATVTAVVMLEALHNHIARGPTLIPPVQFDSLVSRVLPIAANILQAGGLTKTLPHDFDKDRGLEDERFDIEHFELLHQAFVPILRQSDTIREDLYKEYAIVLFHASLLAKPWFHDIPDDLLNSPLKDLTTLRPGSVHRPVFAPRRQICYAALKALFELVSQPERHALESSLARKDEAKAQLQWSRALASAAAPYLILRVVHPLKTFMADQRLRSLSPPPMPQQVELQVILSKFVELRSDGHAMRSMLQSPTTPSRSGAQLAAGDGKEHLRILYAMMLRVQKIWLGLPRLKGPDARAWQDDEPGEGIQKALHQWQEAVSQEWGIPGISP